LSEVAVSGNGSIAYIISQDRPGTSNSLTLDYLIGDEAKYLDYEKLKDETFPANGGYKGHFGNRSYHHSMLFISDIGNPMKHSEKWLLISQGFKGQSGLMPMLNSGNNEELILAMEQTGTRTGPEGFKKDKSGEKLAETEEDKLEYRTDGTDAFDTLYIGMNKFPQLASVGFVTSSFT